MLPSQSGLFFLCPSLTPVEQIILPWLQFSAHCNFQHHSLTSSLLKALLGKQPTLNSSQSLDWPTYTCRERRWSCKLFYFNFFASFSLYPTFFTSLLLLGGWCPILLSCDRPSGSRGTFLKGRVVIGLLSSPLGSGMRPDLIRHQDGPMMDMSFNPFPQGGRNGSWRGRGETPQLI